MYRLIISFLIFYLSTQSLFCQLSAKLYHYRPTGELGFVMKPTYSAEIGWTEFFEEDDYFRAGASITCIVMKQRLNPIPIYSILKDGTGTHVYSGTQSFQKYNIYQLFAGFDVAVINKNRVQIYCGFDIILGGADVQYIAETGLRSLHYSGGGIMGGARIRFGTDYKINEHICLTGNYHRSGWLLTEPRALNAANDYSIGIRLNFN